MLDTKRWVPSDVVTRGGFVDTTIGIELTRENVRKNVREKVLELDEA